MLILSYENEFNLHVKEISFSYERMSTKTRFEEEAKGNSEMAYSIVIRRKRIVFSFSLGSTSRLRRSKNSLVYIDQQSVEMSVVFVWSSSTIVLNRFVRSYCGSTASITLFSTDCCVD